MNPIIEMQDRVSDVRAKLKMLLVLTVGNGCDLEAASDGMALVLSTALDDIDVLEETLKQMREAEETSQGEPR